MTHEEIRNFVIQGILITFYLGLAGLFSFDRRTWPMAVYYIGCFVKDSGVLALGVLLAKSMG